MRRPFQRDAVAVAVEALSWMDLEGISERQAFARTARQLGVTDGRALRMALLLIIETTRRLNLIDNLLVAAVSHSTFEELDLGQRNLLRSFTYWVKIRRQPEEAIPYLEAARQAMGWKQLHPLEMHIGEILAKKQDATHVTEEEHTSFETFNQTWFVRYCIRTFGRRLALRYLRSTIERPSTYIRVNTLVNPPIKCRSTMEGEGILLAPIEPLRNVFRVLGSREPLTKTESYRSGLFHIQDKSSCLSIQVADIRPGEYVLDMCAAPGGKTSHMAAQMENSGTIVSLDYSIRRMRTWNQTAGRLGVKCAMPLIADGLRALPLTQKVDAAILDPPCTSSGAFGRTPSAKWRMTPTSIERATEIQSRLLENVAPHVKEGGRLIYSTCSVTAEENELLIRIFLRSHPEYHLVRQEPFIGSKGLMGLELCQRLFQHNEDCNGYFIAKLQNSGES